MRRVAWWPAACVALVLLAVAPWGERQLLPWLAPAWAQAAGHIDPDFVVREVGITGMRAPGRGGELRMQVTPARFIVLGAHVLDPADGQQGSASVPRGIVWSTVVVFAAVLLGWPWPARRADAGMASLGAQLAVQAAARVALGLPVLAMLLVVSVPVQLLGQVHAALAEQVPRLDWVVLPALGQFLASGGRFVAAAAGAALCAQAAAVLTKAFAAGSSGPRRTDYGAGKGA